MGGDAERMWVRKLLEYSRPETVAWSRVMVVEMEKRKDLRYFQSKRDSLLMVWCLELL